jgi:hypothetical protein
MDSGGCKEEEEEGIDDTKMLIDIVDRSKTKERQQKYNKGNGIVDYTFMMNKMIVLYFLIN